tara:strand:- start:404 stop:604 length:201 start_codon:yes stop_codon:yes gene_type:complete
MTIGCLNALTIYETTNAVKRIIPNWIKTSVIFINKISSFIFILSEDSIKSFFKKDLKTNLTKINYA